MIGLLVQELPITAIVPSVGETKLGKDVITKPITSPGLKDIIKPGIAFKLGVSTFPREAVRVGEVSLLRELSRTRVRQAVRVREAVRARVRARVRVPTLTREIIKVPRIAPPFAELQSLDRRAKVSGSQEFAAIIRRKGKDVFVGLGPLNIAQQAGATAARQTLARSFRIVPTGRRTTVRDIRAPDLSQFRLPAARSRLPRGSLVERSLFALTEEQPEIMAARRKAPRRKARKKVKSNRKRKRSNRRRR